MRQVGKGPHPGRSQAAGGRFGSSVWHRLASRFHTIGPGRFGEQPSRVRLPALVIPPRRTLLGAAAVRRRLKKRR